jgi:hypothetical protein
MVRENLRFVLIIKLRFGIFLCAHYPATSQMPPTVTFRLFRVLRSGDTTDICDILRLRRDNSANKFQYILFLKLGLH